MAIKCFSPSHPGYKTISNRLAGIFGFNVDRKFLSSVIYDYVTKKGIDAEDALSNPEYFEELNEYVNNEFLVDRFVDLEDDEANKNYENWYIDNADNNGIIDTTGLSQEQIDDIVDIASGAARFIDKNHIVVPKPKGFKNPNPEWMTAEMLDIKSKAEANGTFMKAPNGRPTNLTTEKQWLQVRTKAFKDWFGDWENDPANASKVIDENGEPLVVYHGTNEKFTTFNGLYTGMKTSSFSKSNFGREFYFTPETDSARMYGNIIMPAFLNIRNLYKDIVMYDEVGSVVDKIHSDYDGAYLGVNESLETPIIEPEYIVFNANQIKSATENNGEFSREDNNIYHNRTLDTINVLESLLQEQPYTRYHDGAATKVSTPLIKKIGGGYALTNAKGLTRDKQLQALKNALEKRGLDTDYIGVTEDGFVYEKNRKHPIVDRIDAFEESEDLFESKKQHDQAIAVLEFLQEKTGLNYSFITEEKAKELLKKDNVDGINAFALGNTAYFIKGGNRRFNTDIAAEEMLHPFVAAIKLQNKEAFNSLLADARKSFPKLALQIEGSYDSNIDEEIVTQSLSRAFRKDFEENPNHNSIVDLILKFWETIKSWFSEQSDIVFIDEKNPNLFATDLGASITIDTLAKLVNSELKLESANRIDRAALSQAQQQKSINIWAGKNPENADLSNMAQRPFTYNGVQYTSVESAFQATKFRYAAPLTQQPTEVQRGFNNHNLSSFDAKRLGKKIVGLDKAKWDADRFGIMKDLIKTSFQQNPQALKRLLDTGDAVLTHNQERGIWKTEFPRILMDVRNELRTKKQRKLKEYNSNLGNNISIQKHIGDWTRKEAQENPNILYVFTDNTDRDSGSGKISADSWYAKKYGQGRHFPTMTAAVVRGLENSRPISTQRWYHQGAKGTAGRWTDADVKEFKKVIREELQEIVNELNTGKYNTIMFPDGDGLFNTSISNITKVRTPQLYQALADLLHEFGFDSLIPSDAKPQNTQNKKQKKLKEYNPDQEVKPAKKSFEQQVDEIKEGLREIGNRVVPDKNFKKNHTYLIDGKKADVSVTGIRKFLSGEEDEKGASPATVIGSSFDAMVRDFFKTGRLLGYYPNLMGQTATIKSELQNLKSFFDKKFKYGYEVITDEDLLRIGGYITHNNKRISVAGTMDMLVIARDKNGNVGGVYIYDVKTSKNKDISGDTLVKYTDQVNFYKKLLSVNATELADKIKGIGLIVANTQYGENGYNSYDDYKVAKDGETVTYEGDAIEGTKNEITVRLKGELYDTDGYITSLDSSDYIDEADFDFEGLFQEEKEALSGLGQDEGAVSLFLKAGREIKAKSEGEESDFSADERYKSLSENVPILDNSCPCSEREQVFLGRVIIRQISDLADELATDVNKKIKIFGSEAEGSSYKDDYFIGKRKTLMTQDVFNALKTYLFEETDIFDINSIEDEVVVDKFIWVAEHVDALINAAYADLLDIERVSISTSDKDGSPLYDITGTTADILEAYELAEEAVEERAAYTIDSREQSYIGSMSSEFKRALNKIWNYVYDEDGNIVINEDGDPEYVLDEFGFGIATYIPKTVVVNKLFEICYGLGDSRQMLNAIKEESVNTPWLNQVYDIISNDEELSRQLFTVFRKSKNNYEKIHPDREDDTITFRQFNDGEKVKRALQRINSILQSNSLVLIQKSEKGANMFTIDRDTFDELNESEGKHKAPFEVISSNTSSRKDKARAVKTILSYLGFEDINGINNLSSRDSKNILSDIIAALKDGRGSIKMTIKRLVDSNKPFSFEKELTPAYRRLVNAMAPLLDEISELSAHDNKKNYSVYSDPTAIQTIVDRLAGRATVPYLGNGELPSKSDLYDKLFSDKYDNPAYWQFGYGVGSDRVYFCDWLKQLKENRNGERDIFSHSSQTSVQLNKKSKEYLKQNSLEYMVGVLMEYAAPAFTINGKRRIFPHHMAVARYRIPTMSDKPANEFIQFTKYEARIQDADNNFGLDEMKQQISDKAFEFVRFEIRRMRELISQLQDGNPADDVEFFSIPRNSEIYKDLANGSDLKLSHLVRDGKLVADSEYSGLKFEFLPMLNDELLGNTEYAKLIVDAINGNEAELDALRDGFDKIFDKALTKEVKNMKSFLSSRGGNKFLINSIDDITNEEELGAFITEFVWNDTLAAMNMFNLTVVDPAFHKNSSDLQKRFAEFHASTQRPDLLATFKDRDGVTKRVSDGKLRYVVLEDEYASSDKKLVDDIASVFKKASKKAPNKARAAELKAMAAITRKNFKDIILTDGQALGSPTGFWKKLAMLGQNNPDLFAALERIKSAGVEEISLKDLDICIQAFKPFVFSQREQSFGDGKILAPTQIKDSEAMLYLAGAIMKSAGKTGLLPALYQIMEDSHYGGNMEKGEYSDHGIDMFVFHSAVKTGASRIINLNGVASDDIYDHLKKLLYKRGKYTDYVQEVSFEDWGKQQEVPSHLQDHEQGMPSQGRVLSVSDLIDTKDFKFKDKKGKEVVGSKDKFLKRYFALHTEVFERSIAIAKKKLGLDTDDELEANRKLSEILIDNIAKDARYSIELRKAFTLVNGKFQVPIGDPSFGDKVYGAVLSILKKTINDEKYLGGPTVIRSSVGFDKDLSFFKDKDGGYTAEVFASFPSTEIEEKMTYNSKYHRHIAGLYNSVYRDGDIISVSDGLKYGLITEDDIRGIADRIPTENKYSQIRYRIKQFLPRASGEYFIFPKEKTMLGGDDFDIDKVYPRRKYKADIKFFEKRIESGEMTREEAEEIVEIQKLKNEIFDMQWQALGHKSSLTKLFKPGSFKVLKDIAAIINPNFGHENHPLVYFSSQVFYQKANSAGKQFVGIAALNNTAHAFCEMAKCGFTEMIPFKINGVHSDAMLDKESGEYKFDMMYSPFDGSLISDSLCMFVGASADNAKDAVLGALNTNPTTANIFMGLVRMGIPLKTAIFMMNLPSIKMISERAEYSDKRFEDVLISADIAKQFEVEDSSAAPLYESIDITDDALLESIKSADGNIGSLDIAVYQLLRDLVPYCNAIRAVTDRTAVNSTKNAAHKSGYDAMMRKLKAEDFANENFDKAYLLGESAIKINETIPMLGVLSDINETLIPEVFRRFSPIFSRDFKNDNGTGVLDKLMAKGYDSGRLNEKALTGILNAWLVFKATKFGIIDASEKARTDRIYKYVLNFLNMQSALGDNMFIQNLEISTMNAKYPIQSVKFRSSSFSRETKDDIAAAYGDISRSDNMRPYLDDFLDYMISRYGFSYSPQSSMPILPNLERVKYKDGQYRNIFEKELTGSQRLVDIPNFVVQYARNNIFSPLWLELNRDLASVDGNDILVDGSFDVSLKGKVGIRINRSLYVPVKMLDSKASATDTDGRIRLRRVTRLGIDNQFLEYNADEDGYKMKTVITSDNNQSQKKSYDALFEELNEPDADEDANEGGDTDDFTPGNEDNSTEFVKFDWFEKIRAQKNFKAMIDELGISDDIFDQDNEIAVRAAISKVVKKGGELNDKKYKAVLDKLNKELCR